MSNSRPQHDLGSSISRLPALAPALGTGSVFPFDRRREARYALCLECDLFSVEKGHGPVWLQSGKTAVWSRHSVLVRTSTPLSPGIRIQLRARWGFGLMLTVSGQVIRNDNRGIVIGFNRAAFRGDRAAHWNQEVARRADSRSPLADLAFGA